MRILFVHGDTRAPGEGGGAESLLRDQAQGLQALGHEVAWYNGNGIFEKQLELYQPDVVHFMTIHCYPMGLIPLIYCQTHNIPHIMHIQDYWQFCGNRMLMINNVKSCQAVEGGCIQLCPDYIGSRYLDVTNKSYIVAGNQYTAEIYKRNGGRCDAVVELGVDTEMFKPDNSQRGGDPRLYTSCAQISGAWKGMHTLQEALVGTGINCTIISGKPRQTVADELKHCDVFVFPSLYEETFGLSLCEAMASGCACIGTDVAGSKAQIDNGTTGIIVPHGNIQELKHAIIELMSDKWMRGSMGSAARTHAEEHHTLEAMAMRFITVYREVINGS